MLPSPYRVLWRQMGASVPSPFTAPSLAAAQVVRRPVVVAGNSIGGFISASMAGDYPGLVEGLVLLNSAGAHNAICTQSSTQPNLIMRRPD